MDALISDYLSVDDIIEETRQLRLFHEQDDELVPIDPELIVIAIYPGGNFILFHG